ncbi:glycosyltransferase family 2 protein [Poseidonocella sedimentorum]|uniref:Glycosyl transferase family 2 n=1 Tax=Poseidonocella sedimentorum TaxID=871652 RepID=A0A1I6CUM4_9RHOB|nr:glycosyltransferase family 2 protein [Poseidonocella sedimentorum]SFQ96856.1 Glycosyl transferase family 2 [Poseidonocella sedimentorum]
MRITAVTCVKNEGPFLVEWVAFNRMLGVTDFVFYSNDCTDGTAELLDAMAEDGLVQHLPNPAQGRNYQMEALRDAQKQPVVREADWIWVSDVDEFAHISVGDGTFPALIAACGAPEAISLTFRFFANGGIDRFDDAPVTGQFTRTHDPDVWTDELAQEVKTLFRSDLAVQYFGAHRPFLRNGDGPSPRWTDGAGRPVPRPFLLAETKTRMRKFPAHGARAFASLNHYALRSLDSYIVKTDRGDVNRAGRAFETEYWQDRNDGAREDRAMLSLQPRLLAAMAALKARGRIGACHDAAVAAHRALCDRLMADPEVAALARALRAAPELTRPELALLERLA